MQNKIKTNSWKVFLLIVALPFFIACGEMLNNPTIDKDTGEDINLLIVDFNFFTTRASYKFIDVSDNSIITKPAKIWFTGSNANDIVNFAGEKKGNYTTSQGQIELTFDPNVAVSVNSPLEFAVHAEIEGYQTFSQALQINSEGKKTFELLLTKESGEETTLTGQDDGDSFIFSFVPATKSGQIEEKPYSIVYSILKSDLIGFQDIGNNFVYNPETTNSVTITILKNFDFPLIIDGLSVNDITQMVGFQKIETGSLTKIMVNGKRVVNLNNGTVNLVASFIESPQPDVFGFAEFDTDKWVHKGTLDTLKTFGASYNLISASLAEIATLGCNITFSSSSKSSFSIDADIYDSNSQLIKTINFKGNFPETFILENVPEQSATMVFRNNNPSFQPIANLEINNLASGSYEVDIIAIEGFEEYQIAFKALCAGNATIAIAPTYSGEIRIKNSDDDWQGIDMIGGVVDILAKPNQEYEIRLLWKDQWETSTFKTEFDTNGNYINSTSSKVTSEKMEDGRTRIKIEHEFEQNVCDDMNW